MREWAAVGILKTIWTNYWRSDYFRSHQETFEEFFEKLRQRFSREKNAIEKIFWVSRMRDFISKKISRINFSKKYFFQMKFSFAF